MQILIFTILIFFSTFTLSLAGEADVLEVRIDTTGESALQVWATVQHDDEGWEHYADKWEILDMEGNILDTRVLLHPHSPAPFTRSIPRAKIPDHVTKIRVRAHDSVHGYGGKEVIIEVPQS
jgi:hypothetical protein